MLYILEYLLLFKSSSHIHIDVYILFSWAIISRHIWFSLIIKPLIRTWCHINIRVLLRSRHTMDAFQLLSLRLLLHYLFQLLTLILLLHLHITTAISFLLLSIFIFVCFLFFYHFLSLLSWKSDILVWRRLFHYVWFWHWLEEYWLNASHGW